MAEEYWKTSPFGADSYFAPGWDEKQKQESLQRLKKAEIIGINIEKGSYEDKKLLINVEKDNLDPMNYRPPSSQIRFPVNLYPPIEQAKLATVPVTVLVTIKGLVDNINITVNGDKRRAEKRINGYFAVFDLKIPLKAGKKEFEITAQITDFIGGTVLGSKKISFTISSSGDVLASKEILTVGNWFVNLDTAEYVWFDDKLKREGYTRVGHYKVTYNSEKNVLSVYAGKESMLIESIDMSHNEDGKYKFEEATKFALIAAESGGSYVYLTDDPTILPLIVGGCIENRLRLYSLGFTEYATGNSVADVKGFQADNYVSFKDFKIGNKKRFGLGESVYQKKRMLIGLSTVYTAVVGSVRNLNEYYSVSEGEVKQFEQMIFYAHIPPDGKTNTSNGDFDIAIPEGTSGKFDYVRGSNEYKNVLNPK